MLKQTFLGLALAGSLLAALSTGVLADEHTWHHDQYDTWWRGHRDVAVEVQEHPEYLRDRAWRARHHDVDVWLNQNPTYVQTYVANPYPIVVTTHRHEQRWHRYDDGHWGW